MGWSLATRPSGRPTSIGVLASVLLGGCISMAEPTYLERLDRERALCEGFAGHHNPLDHLFVRATRPIAGFHGRPRVYRVRGTRMLVDAPVGWSAPFLHRACACRVERMALLMPEERPSGDPLAVEGVRVEVRPAGGRYELRLTTHDADRARELHQLAQQLMN